jgi:hypothetical protein
MTVTSSVVVLSCLLLVAPAANAEIFKCVAKNGTDLYQNFPCDVDSMGSVATTAPHGKPGIPKGDAKHAKEDVHVAAGSGVVPAKSTVPPVEPRVGMTADEVRAVWGEATETLWEEPGVGPRSELWLYDHSRFVRFVRNRVSAIQK